jgi:hypothetical protein
MAISHQTVVYDVNDFKVWALTSDLPTDASPVYGATIDVPGISSVTLDPTLITAELLGDSRVISKKGKIDKLTVGFTHGVLNVDVNKATMGGTISDVTGTPNETRWDLLTGQPLPYFACGFEMNDVSTDQGILDLHVLIYKAQITGGQLFNPGSNKYSEPTGQLEGFAPNASSGTFRSLRVRLLDTVTALSIAG